MSIEKLAIKSLISDINDDNFDLKYSIEEAKQNLEYENQFPLANCSFESNIWEFEFHLTSTKVYLDFNKLYEAIRFHTNKKWKTDLVVVVKCWIASNLKEHSSSNLRVYYNSILGFIQLSHCFNPDLINDVRNYLTHSCNEVEKYTLTYTLLNFIDYYEQIDKTGTYRQMLLDISDSINKSDLGNIRTLPPAKDVVIFAWILEDFWSKIQIGNLDYFKYFPVYMWWHLTNLIPIRPSEFCHISRESLYEENGKHYIRLPRIKQKKSRKRVQIVDKIHIPERLYCLLNRYKKVTDGFGDTDTFIHYKAIQSPNENLKYNTNRFTRSILNDLIKLFYLKIVQEEYGYQIVDKRTIKSEKEESDFNVSSSNDSVLQKIQPGDTRHFAFLNLRRQGYHPVEIARLGGHINIHSQYHYYQHDKYWIDVETLQLMLRFSLKEKFLPRIGSPLTANLYIDNEFKRKHIFAAPATQTEIDLDLGYCTDSDQACPVEDCVICPSWRITPEEFKLKSLIIEQKLQNINNDIIILLDTLKNLHNLALSKAFDEEDFREENWHFNRDMLLTSRQLDTKLHQSIQVCSILKNQGR